MKIDVNKIWYPFKEYWRDIKNWEGYYQISNWGRSRSLDREFIDTLGRHQRIKGKILTPKLDKYGYLQVTLYNGKRKQTNAIARLVSTTFIPNLNNLPQINHRSEIKTENWVKLDEQGNVIDSNLEWCSVKYNINYGKRTAKQIATQLNRNDLSIPVLQYTLNGEFVAEYPSEGEAERQTGFLKTGISHCCRNATYTDKNGYTHRCLSYKGFIWKYKEGEAS